MSYTGPVTTVFPQQVDTIPDPSVLTSEAGDLNHPAHNIMHGVENDAIHALESFIVNGGVVPSFGCSFVMFGHYFAAGGGSSGDIQKRTWFNILMGMLRGHLWNQAWGGAVAAKAGLARGTAGWGGVREMLQGTMPNPETNTNWRGAYNAGVSYSPMDGVISGGNWYRLEGSVVSTGTAPPGGNWVQVGAPGGQNPSSDEATAYLGMSRIPILWYGNNDLGFGYQGVEQPFLTAMETILARACAAQVFDANSSMISYAGGSFANNANNYGASGSSIETIPATAGATISFTTPADWPGGYVDFIFSLVAGGSGAVAFTVDGAATNVVNSGTVNSNIVNFGNPLRNHIDATALTAALAAGVAVTQLPVNALSEGIANGATITVGTGATADTFVANGATAAGANSITVTSHAPVNQHPINDSVYDSTSNAASRFNAIITVRVPTTAGSHTIVGTIQAAPALVALYFSGVSLEAQNPPPIIVPSLFYLANYFKFWPTRVANDQMVDTWNTALQNLIAQFPSASYINITSTYRAGAQLVQALAQGQAGINQLQVQPLPYTIQPGDYIEIGSGTTQQEVQASALAAAGSQVVAVNPFTSLYNQPVGNWVWDSTIVQPNTNTDDVHPSDLGHELLAIAFFAQVSTISRSLTAQQIARASVGQGDVAIEQRLNATNLTVGTGTANQWGVVKAGANPPVLFIPADPGDVLEIDLNGAWNAVSGSTGNLDIATWDYYANAPLNYVSGSTYQGSAGTSGLGGDSVGAQLSNGLSPLLLSGIAGFYQPIVGHFSYVVQAADIRQGGVYLVLYGKSSIATTQTILASGGNAFYWAARNKGPFSANANAA